LKTAALTKTRLRPKLSLYALCLLLGGITPSFLLASGRSRRAPGKVTPIAAAPATPDQPELETETAADAETLPGIPTQTETDAETEENPFGAVEEEAQSAPDDSLVPDNSAAASATPESVAVENVWIWQETGDCLWKMAKEFYGDPYLWPRIYDANRETISNPNVIFPKQQIVIPPQQEARVPVDEEMFEAYAGANFAVPEKMSQSVFKNAREEVISEYRWRKTGGSSW
jgi:nucleoid-associated protein YgaU